MIKKFSIGLCAIALAMGGANTAFALNVGFWDLSSGFENGSWSEAFTGGGPGQSGNTLTAASTPAQWSMSGFTLVGSPTMLGPNHYLTTYNNGSITLAAGPWGGPVILNNMTALNESTSDGAGTALDFAIAITGSDGVHTVTFNAEYSGSVAGLDYSGVGLTGHSGQGFQLVSMTVPDGGSTLALLGLGLMGLLAFRRK